MAFIDDLKTDQRTQILVGGIIFFAIAFPVYFSFAAGEVDSYSSSGPVGTYEVSGEYSYHEIGSGSETIGDGETANVMANSDAAGDSIKGKNIVGVRATLTFTDGETQSGLGCAAAQGPQDDDVSGHIMYAQMEQSSQLLSGESVMIEWHDSSILGTTVTNMSEGAIELMLSGMGLGLGEHSLDISVSVNTGGALSPTCSSNDDGETVSYVIELISLEYTITMVEE